MTVIGCSFRNRADWLVPCIVVYHPLWFILGEAIFYEVELGASGAVRGENEYRGQAEAGTRDHAEDQRARVPDGV